MKAQRVSAERIEGGRVTIGWRFIYVTRPGAGEIVHRDGSVLGFAAGLEAHGLSPGEVWTDDEEGGSRCG
jgi:hypothetical protein